MIDRATQKKIDAAVNAHHGVDLRHEVSGEEVGIVLAHKIMVGDDDELRVAGEASFEDALTAEIAKRPHWQPTPVDTELEDQVRSGNVTAAGRLHRQLGEDGFRLWQKENAVTVGKTTPVAENRKAAASNPWSAAGWSLKKQGELINKLGQLKADAIARAAGCKIGSTRANPAFN